MPAGYEFISLIQAILLVGGRASTLSAESLALIAGVDSPVTMHVFTTPTCPHCPRAVSVAHEMAFANPNITAYAVEATEFPDLARRYRVTGVPKTVVNDAATGRSRSSARARGRFRRRRRSGLRRQAACVTDGFGC